ncbi:hypothetical protein HRbin26_01411 [bacterium HR26]|nr:hypothetical protein HRbin26_01411 [bacterium HR26]
MLLLTLIFLAALVLLALFALTVTIGVTLTSLVTLVTAPGQLLRLLRDRRLRRNHALEHATINVIEERYGPSRLTGMARPDGFLIRGGAPAGLVLEAAQEALERLRAGERRLAIHPRCGTTLVASQLVLALTFLGVLLLTRQLTLWPFLAGILAAGLLGPRLSPWLQRWVTTDARVGSLAITGIEVQPWSAQLGWAALVMPGSLFVRTAQAGTPGEEGEDESGYTVVIRNQEEIPGGRYRIR